MVATHGRHTTTPPPADTTQFPEQIDVNIDKQIMNAPSEGAKYIGAHL